MPTTGQRYLNLVVIELGEAVTAMGRLRQLDAEPGSAETTAVKHHLRRALAALDGVTYLPIVEQEVTPP